MLGAARLSVDTFEDVERDSSATIQALIVVIIVALASGIGELLSGEADILRALVFGLIRGIISWAIWALIAMFVGTKILKTEQTEADWGQLARGTGFAQTPGILTVLVFVPAVGTTIGVIALFWQLAAMVVAVRQTLDYTSTLRAFFVILIAFIPVLIINAILFWLLRV
jgi:hypothetical protein